MIFNAKMTCSLYTPQILPGHLLFSLLQKSTNYTTTAWTIHMLFKFMKPLSGLPGTMHINTLMTLWQVNYKKHFLQIPSWKWKLCRSAFRRCSSNLRFKTTTEQTDMDFQQTCCDSSGTLNLIHSCASLSVCVSNGFRTLICFEELNDHAVCHLKHHRRMHLAVIGCLTYDQAKKDVELVSERHLQSHVTCAFSWQVGHTKLLRSTAGAVRETLCALWMYSLAAQCLVKRIKRKATAQVDHKHEIVYVSACKFKQTILSINTSQQRYINNL